MLRDMLIDVVVKKMMKLSELVLLADDRSSALLGPYRRNPAMDKSPAELILKKNKF